MAFSRPQFRLSTLLWITLAVACWFGGVKIGDWRERRAAEEADVKILGGARVYPVGDLVIWATPSEPPAPVQASPPAE